MAKFTINGTTVEFHDTGGSSEAVVLVHGSASDYRTWRHQRQAFARYFRVISYSRRYHWPNADIPDGVDYSMIQHVDDLRSLLLSLDTGPVHLVGHSYGGYVCLLLTACEPELVRSLVLEEPPVIPLLIGAPPRPYKFLRLLLTSPRDAGAVIRFVAGGVLPASAAFKRSDLERGLQIFGEAVFGREAFHSLPASRIEQSRDNLSTVRAELLGSGFAPLSPALIRGIDRPTLVVAGRDSIRLLRSLTDRLQQLLPHVERVDIAGASHLAHEQNPDMFNRSVISFLQRL